MCKQHKFNCDCGPQLYTQEKEMLQSSEHTRNTTFLGNSVVAYALVCAMSYNSK